MLELELSSFQQTAKEYLKSKQDNTDDTSKRLTATIKEKEELIAKLQKELEADVAQLKTLQTDLAQVTARVESNRMGFMKVYQQLVDQIQLDIQNMDRYLK